MRQRHAGASSITLLRGCNDPRHAHPSQKHAETNSLIEMTRPLSQADPCQCCCERPGHRGPDTNQTLMSKQPIARYVATR